MYIDCGLIIQSNIYVYWKLTFQGNVQNVN
jgi:hypothetical protein